jgi:hypothetical protein
MEGEIIRSRGPIHSRIVRQMMQGGADWALPRHLPEPNPFEWQDGDKFRFPGFRIVINQDEKAPRPSWRLKDRQI